MQAMPQYRAGGDNFHHHDGVHGRGGRSRGMESSTGVGGEGLGEYLERESWGPDTPALGERTNIGPVTQAQIKRDAGRVCGEGLSRRGFEGRAGDCGRSTSSAANGTLDVDDFALIHSIIWIQGSFDSPHEFHRVAIFVLQVFQFFRSRCRARRCKCRISAEPAERFV